MLIKMLPTQAVTQWSKVSKALDNSIFPLADKSPDRMLDIMTKVGTGVLTCWWSVNKSDEFNDCKGVVITKVFEDFTSKTRSLLIFCLCAFERQESKEYISAVDTLLRYAEGEGCSNIILYSSNEKMTKLLKKHGGNTDHTLVMFPLFNK